MNPTEIQSAIDLHQKAFAFLLAARANGHAASSPFDEATVSAWRQTSSCVEWINRHYNELPMAYRPEPADVDAFAHFLVSFFATSFAVSQTIQHGRTQIQIRALPNRRLDGSKKSKHAKEKERRTSDTLRQIALTTLAAECEAPSTDEQILMLLHEPTLAEDVTLWTYAIQLVNRSRYASQGPAVYQLWLDLSEKSRRGLSADRVWKSRGRLVQFLLHLPQPITK